MVRIYTKGAPDVLWGKNKEEVEALANEIQQDNTMLNYAQCKARAEK